MTEGPGEAERLPGSGPTTMTRRDGASGGPRGSPAPPGAADGPPGPGAGAGPRREIAAKVQAKAKLEQLHRREVREHQRSVAVLEERLRELAATLARSADDTQRLTLLGQRLQASEQRQEEEERFQQLCEQRKTELEALALGPEELRLWRGFKALREEAHGLRGAAAGGPRPAQAAAGRGRGGGGGGGGAADRPALPQEVEDRLATALDAVVEELEDVEQHLAASPSSPGRRALLDRKGALLVARTKAQEEYAATVQASVQEAEERRADQEREALRRALWKEEQRPREEEAWRAREREYRRQHRELEQRRQQLGQALQRCAASGPGRLRATTGHMEVLEAITALGEEHRQAEEQAQARLGELRLTPEETRLLRGCKSALAFTSKRPRSLSVALEGEEPPPASPTDCSPNSSASPSLATPSTTPATQQQERALLRRARAKKEQAQEATDRWEKLEKTFRSQMRHIDRQLSEVQRQLSASAVSSAADQLVLMEQQLRLTTAKQNEEEAHKVARDRHLAELEGLQLDGEETRVWRGAEALLKMTSTADAGKGPADARPHRRSSSLGLTPTLGWQGPATTPARAVNALRRLASPPMQLGRPLHGEGWTAEGAVSSPAQEQGSPAPSRRPSLRTRFREMAPEERAQALKELDLKILQAQTDPERILLLSRKLKLLQAARARRDSQVGGPETLSSTGPIRLAEASAQRRLSLPGAQSPCVSPNRKGGGECALPDISHRPSWR